MHNVNFIEVELMSVITNYAIIDHGNGGYTSMLKSTYDEQLAQSKEIMPPTIG